jgi:hypothetical protein
MNHNSLITVVEADRARFFRTAITNRVDQPVELIEVDTISSRDDLAELSEAPASGARQAFARRIAERVARFAEYHYCNPVIVAAPPDVAPLVADRLGRHVGAVQVRSFVDDWSQLAPSDVLERLQKRGAFSAVHHAERA